jgi:hypothetical protein
MPSSRQPWHKGVTLYRPAARDASGKLVARRRRRAGRVRARREMHYSYVGSEDEGQQG